MCKNIQEYKQHGPTCAIACSMMIMNYYGYMDSCNRLIEKKLYNRYKSKYMDGAHYSGVASFLARNGIKVELLHSEQTYFSNEKGFIPDKDYKYIYQEYTDFIRNNKNKNLNIKCNVDINMSFIRKKLEEGKLVMLAGNIGKNLHSILICGYKDKDFIVCDPLIQGKKIISNDELTQYMKTPIGSWCIVTEKENKEVDKLLEKCQAYQQEADDFLKLKYNNRNEK